MKTTSFPTNALPPEVKETFKDSPAPLINVVGLTTVILESTGAGAFTTEICTDAEHGDMSPSPANSKLNVYLPTFNPIGKEATPLLSVILVYDFVPSLKITSFPAKGVPSEVKVTWRGAPSPFMNVVGLVTVNLELLSLIVTLSVALDGE